MWWSTARRAAAIPLALLVAMLGGCGLGVRERYADRILGAPTAAVAARTANIRIDAAATFVQTEGLATTIPEGAVQRASIEATVNFTTRSAVLQVPGQAQPFAVVDGETVYVRRTDVRADDARPWAMLDFKTLDDEPDVVDPVEISPVASVAVLPPYVLVDLLGGALTGSIERDEAPEGADAFRANFDLEKAVRDTRRRVYPEEVRDAFENVVALIGLSSGPHKGRVVVDGDSRPQAFALRLALRPARYVKVDLMLDVTVTGYGAAYDVDVPKRTQLVYVAEPSRLLRFAADALQPVQEVPQ